MFASGVTQPLSDLIISDGKHEARKVPPSLVRQPALPHLLCLGAHILARRLRCRHRLRLRTTAGAEPGHDERGVAVLADLGDAPPGPHGPRVHPVQRPRRVGALRQHRRPERVQRPDLEREAGAAAAAGEEAHEDEVLVRARAVEPPVDVWVEQAAHGVAVAALQGAVQLLHHRLAADPRRLVASFASRA
ncbi:unnamed protein product [Urochloa decumbens]|uniref:Uncharacterized protein n=1 Tax=Urochloa decumbens TaxID=240449 RepID=A0ABC8W038_9POAL